MTKPSFSWRELAAQPNFLFTLLKLAILVAFLLIIYFQDFGQMLSLALGNSEVQYVLIVPLVSIFFFYVRRNGFLFPNKNNILKDIIGALTCLLALFIYVYGSYSLYAVELHLLTLPLFASGIIILLFGINTLKTLAFPVILLIFISPFPVIFSNQFGGSLIETTTNISANFLKLFLPINFSLQPTAIISLVSSAGQPITFEIAPACSGIYSLISMLFFAVIFLFIVSGSWIKKIAFASLAIITAFLLNILRIVLTVTLGYSLGYGIAVEFFHDFAGIVLLFLGALLLLLVGDKLLKLSFMKETNPNCRHTNHGSICLQCGKVFAFSRTPLNWKRLTAIMLFTLVLTALFLQASASAYNTASSNKNNNISLNLSTGNTTAFSGLTGWSTQFSGRDDYTEKYLGLYYIGNYYLSNSNLSQVNAILELSDAQSKFHPWEICINYQTTPMTITQRTDLTLYDQNNTIIKAAKMVSDVPSNNQTLVLLYWLDSANIEVNGNISPWAIKITLYQTNDNSVDPTQVGNSLVALGQQLVASWSQYKSPAQGFSADIYRNITPISAIAIAALALTIIMYQVQPLMNKKPLTEQKSELPTPKKPKKKKLSPDNPSEANTERNYFLINGQPYTKSKSQTS
jgi:exosortase